MTQNLCVAMNGLRLNNSSSSFLTGQRLSAASPVFRPSSMVCSTIEAAHKKGAGSTKNGRDSISKRRGVKVFGMQKVKAGGIILRQLGTKFHPGEGVGLGRDYTIFAKEEGVVLFERGKGTRRVISVYPDDHPKIQAKREPAPERTGPTRKERRRAFYTPRAIQRQRTATLGNSK